MPGERPGPGGGEGPRGAGARGADVPSLTASGDAEFHCGSQLAAFPAFPASRRPPGHTLEQETHLERGCAAGAGLGERADLWPLCIPSHRLLRGRGRSGSGAVLSSFAGERPLSGPSAWICGPTLPAPAQQPRSPSKGGRSPAPHALFVFLPN